MKQGVLAIQKFDTIWGKYAFFLTAKLNLSINMGNSLFCMVVPDNGHWDGRKTHSRSIYFDPRNLDLVSEFIFDFEKAVTYKRGAASHASV